MIGIKAGMDKKLKEAFGFTKNGIKVPNTRNFLTHHCIRYEAFKTNIYCDVSPHHSIGIRHTFYLPYDSRFK